MKTGKELYDATKKPGELGFVLWHDLRPDVQKEWEDRARKEDVVKS